MTNRQPLIEFPERFTYEDNGCKVAPKCVACPLPTCKHDHPGGLAGALKDYRKAQARALAGAGVPLLDIADTFGVSMRSVQLWTSGVAIMCPPVYGSADANETVQTVLNRVSRQHGVSIAELTGLSRKREIVNARFNAMYLLREIVDARGYPMPLKVIGAIFGRDHSSVIHAIHRGAQREREAKSGACEA